MTEQNQPAPKGPLSPRQADLLLEHLAAGVAAGVPLVELFRALADDLTDSRLRRFAAHLTAQLEQGVDLPTALAAMRPLLPEPMRQALLLGLASGNLPALLSGLAKSERTRNQMRRGLLTVFAYPLLAVGMLLLLLLFISVVVLPDFSDLFQDFDLVLPVITEAIFVISAAFPKVLALLLALGLAPLVIGWMPFGKRLVHRLRTAVPLLGRAWQWAGQHEFATHMAALTRAKIPITEALDCTAGLLRDRNLARAVRRARAECEQGAMLGQSLGQSIHFEPTLAALVAWGEKTETIPEALEEAARTYEQQMAAYLRFLSRVIPPALLLTIASILLLLVAGLFLPLNSGISGLM